MLHLLFLLQLLAFRKNLQLYLQFALTILLTECGKHKPPAAMQLHFHQRYGPTSIDLPVSRVTIMDQSIDYIFKNYDVVIMYSLPFKFI